MRVHCEFIASVDVCGINGNAFLGQTVVAPLRKRKTDERGERVLKVEETGIRNCRGLGEK